MTLWQPMNTAPLDEFCLITGFNYGDPLKGRWVDCGKQRTGYSGATRWFSSNGPEEGFSDPTHWQPMPDEPSFLNIREFVEKAQGKTS